MQYFAAFGSGFVERKGVRTWLLLFVGLALSGQAHAQRPGGEAGSATPVFRSAVDLVSVAAVVRDRQGRLVRDLERADFDVLDGGVPRPIVEFAAAEDGPVSLAVLLDSSGSMAVTGNLDAARRVVRDLLNRLRPGSDEIALYTFDSGVRLSTGFTSDVGLIKEALVEVKPFGTTALFDSVASVTSRLGQRPTRRRALVIVTDGVDTSSALSAPEVSAIASASDVPVYVVTVGLGEKETLSSAEAAFEPTPKTAMAHLGNLAHWTGGALFNGRGHVAAAATAQMLFGELRHQYLLAFESAGPGWRPVDVRLRRSQVTVRTRSAYQSGRPIS